MYQDAQCGLPHLLSNSIWSTFILQNNISLKPLFRQKIDYPSINLVVRTVIYKGIHAYEMEKAHNGREWTDSLEIF